VTFFDPGLYIGHRKIITANQERIGRVAIMNILKEAEELISNMKPAEKAQILQWVVRDLGDAFPGVESDPGVCGGEPCIIRTRIPVWVLIQARKLGTSESALLAAYPALHVEDLANAWAYHRNHRDEIDEQIRDNEQA
jgi:uncharacterized protein (DUF433 family)